MKTHYTKFHLGHEFGYDQATVEITDLGEYEQAMHRIVIPEGYDPACLSPEHTERLSDGRIVIPCCSDFLSSPGHRWFAGHRCFAGHDTP